MSELQARVRAPLTKAVVDLLKKQPPSVQAAVRAKAADAVERVELASRVDWIPLSIQLEILSALHTEVGPEGYDAFCTAHFAATVEQALVKSVFEGTIRVFGISPAALYKVFGKTWPVIASGCGVISIEGQAAPSGTTLHVTELPMNEREIDLFVRGFRATFQGVLDVVKKQGTVVMRSFDRDAGKAVYFATWS
nr:MAG: hypothetical protein DIU78_22310 [Pseudomonadota bacterium]